VTEDKVLSATGSVSSSFAIPTSAKWAIALVSFNPSTTTAPIVYATSTPTWVQGKIEATTSSITLASSVTTGNLVVVGLTACCSGSIPTNAITDNKGNTYTYITQAQHGSDYGALYYAKNVTGGSSFTVTSSFWGTLTVNEYSGVDKSNPLDTSASGIGTSTSLSTATATPSQGGELLVGLGFSMQDGDPWMPGVGYSLRESLTNNATQERHALEDRVLPLVTGTVATFSVPTSEVWLAVMAAFKPLVTSTSSVASSSVAQTYQYDENGRRVMAIDPTSTTTRYYSGLYQNTPGGYKKTKNIYVNDALLATFEKTGSASATPYYVLTDPLNSASVMMNGSGGAAQTLDYLPYGGVRVDAKSTAFSSPRKFLGKVFDDSTQLSYLEHRYLNSGNARFLSQDPLLLGALSGAVLLTPQALNYYSYANGNPINRSDPSGLRSTTDAENIYIQETRDQIRYLREIGKTSVALQMSENLNMLIQEIAGIPTSGGGNFVAAPPVENKFLNESILNPSALYLYQRLLPAFAYSPPPAKLAIGAFLVGAAIGAVGYEAYDHYVLSKKSEEAAKKEWPTGAIPLNEYLRKYGKDIDHRELKGDRLQGAADKVRVVKPGFEGEGDIYVEENGQKVKSGNIEEYQ
jgi:RHS repeat-associated protein